jgi:murein DD-endopeptidase MepM/ murein hydrolase activator NlpD
MNDFNQSFKPHKPSDKKPTDKNTVAKNEKMNRIMYVCAIALLLAVVIIAAVVSATNRAKKEPVETPKQTEQKNPESTPPKPDENPDNENTNDDQPSNENPSDKNPSEDVATKLPTFALPAKGALSTKHDPDMQVFSPTMQDWRVHLGIDINTADKAPVHCAADGKIEKVWEDVRMGWCVAVSHSGGAVSYYKNIDKTLATGIEEGASVKSGQLLGSIGDSAMIEVAQEPHLHFELTVGGLQVDPLEYFSDEALESLSVDAEVSE